MKTILALNLICLMAFSQKCKLEMDEVDEFTKSLKRRTAPMNVAPYELWNLKGSILRINDSYSLSLYFLMGQEYFDLGCVTHKSYVSFKFADGEVIDLMHEGEIDCGGIKSLWVNITPHLEKFKTKPLAKLRYRLESYRDLQPKNRTVIADLIRCVE